MFYILAEWLSLNQMYKEVCIFLNLNGLVQLHKPLKELANRKILEELQQKKQLLLKQGVQSTLSTTSLQGISSPNIASSDGHPLSTAQRTALQTANAQSTGYFITQDSSFGNLILPVLPRFDSK